MWYLITNSAIQDIYEIYRYMYDTKDLVTSVDGCSTRCPNMQKYKSLHHIDKNPTHIIKSYQTGYIFYPATQKQNT